MKRVELIKTLDVVSRGLSNNNIAPTFGFFCFTGETVFSWNDQVAIVGLCKVDKPFGCHGATLLGLLKCCSSDEVDIEVTKDNLLITSGSSDFKLPYISQEEFLWKEPEVHEANLQEPELFEAIKACVATTSSDIALGAFNQICLMSTNEAVIVYSCDGDAITKVTVTGEVLAFENACISKSFAEALSKLDIGIPDLFLEGEWIAAYADSYHIYGRNLGPPQLDYEAEIRKSVGINNYKFVPIPKELNNALSRARVVADAETKPTQFIINNKNIYLGTFTPYGDVDDIVGCDHLDIKANISAAMLQKSLEGCTEFCVTENCVLLKGERILRLLANLGE